MAAPLDYEYYLSDVEMVEDSTSRTGTTTNKTKKKPQVRFITHTGTQTDAMLMLGRSTCITGPAVDLYLTNRLETEGQSELIRTLTRQIERHQKKISRLEKEAIERQVAMTTFKMQTFSLQTKVAISEQVIEEFSQKIRLTTEELARERADRDKDYVSDTHSVD